MKAERARTYWLIPLFFLLFLSWTSQVFADEIILANGDRLTGKIVQLTDNILVLETGYSEPIRIKFAAVRQLSSTDPVEIHLTDGETLRGRISTTDAGRLAVEGSPGRGLVSIELDRITALNPPPREPVSWKGNITVGGSMQSGNSENMNFSTGVTASRRTEIDRFTLNFLYNRAEDDGEKTAENTFTQLKYDYFLNPKWYLYLNIDMLSDEFADINFRTSVGPGVGYQVWEEENKSLSLEAGVSYTSEDRDMGEDDEWFSARAGARYIYKLFDRVLFSDQFVIYPDLENSGEYLLRNEAALVTDIGSSLAFKISNIWERNSAPEPGLDEDDLTWILGLQYSF